MPSSNYPFTHPYLILNLAIPDGLRCGNGCGGIAVSVHNLTVNTGREDLGP